MAKSASYKQYTRNQRRAVLETDYSHGMMTSNSIVDEGYVKSLVNFTFDKESGSLIPRPALRPYQLIMPDMGAEQDPQVPDWWHGDGLSIKDVKECVENGIVYYQIVVGLVDEYTRGHLAIVTTEKTDSLSQVHISDDYEYDIRYGSSTYTFIDEDVLYYSASVPQIHDIFLAEDYSKRMEFPVGSFAYGNSYYFFTQHEDDNHEMVTELCRTYFDTTQIPPRYSYEAVSPKELSVSEAVTYGYNMLLKEQAYTFMNKHAAPTMQFEGLLPYTEDGLTLLMTPRRNQPVLFKAFYDVANGRKFDIVWEWRETTSADWTLLQKDVGVTFGDDTVLQAYFRPPAADMMVRVSAYPYIDDAGQPSTEPNVTVEKAIVVGFDFTVENYGAATTLDQKVYDLSSATGMEAWNGRIVLWGLPEDPSILFLSDYNEPAYFPYPNNIVVFDEPIIYAIEFMDSLCVFTTNKLYQVKLSDDGNSWVSTVVQSHLSINAWDKHLIQTVRNMIYFKSGNYYYMMVPKAQSQTGELTLAPITNPITSFFDNFSVNVQHILEETYGYTGDYELLSYYNFLDYEDIHNLYLYRFDSSEALLHLDIIYSTVDRTWKIWVYESAQILFPFKHNATEPGLLATISNVIADDVRSESQYPVRVIQIFTWDKSIVRSVYLPSDAVLLYDAEQDATSVEGNVLEIPGIIASVDSDGVVVFGDPYADAYGEVITIIGAHGYFSGFGVGDVSDTLRNVFVNADDYFTFKNYQFLDTGYRNDELQANKRYREIQLLVDNLDQTNIQFGMEYTLDGSPRQIYYKYDVAQTIDEFDPEYGIIYIDSTPYLETDLTTVDKTNQWILDQELHPEIAFWKVRISVSGKGTSPRFKLKSRNEKRFGILSINWVARIMNMR